MNIFAKIKLVNKLSKAVKEIKKVLNGTHLDEEIKENISTIVKCVKNIVSKVPELKDPYLTILEILKK